MQTQIEPTNQGHRILVLILVILLTAGAVGGGVYYVLNQQNKDQEKLIEELQQKESVSQTAADKAKKDSEKKEADKAKESKGVKYTNSQYAFELTFPDTWKDYGTEDALLDGATKTIYFGLPRNEVNPTFDFGFQKYYDSPFAISIYTKSQWEAAQSEEMSQVTKLGEKGNYVFGWSQGNGTIDVKGVTQEQAIKDIKTIIGTFKTTD